MKTNKFLYLIFLFLSLSVQAQQTYTLQQCIDVALENNRKIKMQSLAKQDREIAYKQARQNMLPNLNAGAGQDFTFGRSIDESNVYRSSNSSRGSFNVSSNITLFDGLRLKHSVDARKAELHTSEAELEKMQEDIILAVNTTFLQVLMNKELLQIAESQLETTRQSIEQQQILIKNGKLAEGELYELLSQEANEELKRIEASNNVNLSLLDLAQILELDNIENIDVTMPQEFLNTELNLLSPQTVYANAIQNRPEIKAAELRLQSSEKNISIIRSGYYPTLSFGAQWGTGYYNLNNANNDAFSKQFGNNMSTNLGLSLHIPIFNQFDVRNRVKSAKLAVENNKLNIEDTKIELRKTIEQAYQNALAAKARWEAALKSEEAVKEAYRFVNQKYEAGRGSQYDLFQAKNNVTRILSEKAQAKYEYIFRIKMLEMYN